MTTLESNVPRRTPGLADTLKDSTRELHVRAERHPFQAALLTGRAGLDGFVALQSQLRLLHEGFEKHLRTAAKADSRIAGLLRPYHYRETLVRDDLAALAGADAERTVALPAVAAFLSPLAVRATEDPCWFIGALYTLEGSTNGGRFIAAALRKSLKLTSGLSYLEPHGEFQQPRWGEFRAGLDALPLSDHERGRVQAGAADMFAFMIALFDDLTQASPANSASA